MVTEIRPIDTWKHYVYIFLIFQRIYDKIQVVLGQGRLEMLKIINSPW